MASPLFVRQDQDPFQLRPACGCGCGSASANRSSRRSGTAGKNRLRKALVCGLPESRRGAAGRVSAEGSRGSESGPWQEECEGAGEQGKRIGTSSGTPGGSSSTATPGEAVLPSNSFIGPFLYEYPHRKSRSGKPGLDRCGPATRSVLGGFSIASRTEGIVASGTTPVPARRQDARHLASTVTAAIDAPFDCSMLQINIDLSHKVNRSNLRIDRLRAGSSCLAEA